MIWTRITGEPNLIGYHESSRILQLPSKCSHQIVIRSVMLVAAMEERGKKSVLKLMDRGAEREFVQPRIVIASYEDNTRKRAMRLEWPITWYWEPYLMNASDIWPLTEPGTTRRL
jgi:hypothetical protein